jgi:hypothetical protein
MEYKGKIVMMSVYSTALMHDNEQSVTTADAPTKLLMGRLLYESAGKM